MLKLMMIALCLTLSTNAFAYKSPEIDKNLQQLASDLKKSKDVKSRTALLKKFDAFLDKQIDQLPEDNGNAEDREEMVVLNELQSYFEYINPKNTDKKSCEKVRAKLMNYAGIPDENIGKTETYPRALIEANKIVDIICGN